MSHHQGVPATPPPRNPLPVPKARAKSKRLRTKRERNAAKFGPKVALGGSWRGPAAPPRWLQPLPWGGLPLGSPLRPPRSVVITQNRLCHRGLFNHEVKSLDVRRLLTPGPGGDRPPAPAPRMEEGFPAEALEDLVASLASLLGGLGAFLGRELVSERRRSLLAVIRKHRRGPLDLGVFLAHRTPAQPTGQRRPWQEESSGPPGPALNLGGWEAGDAPPARTPSPLRAVHTPLPPRAPSPIFGAPRERENPFAWSSAEDEEDETPGGLTQAWGGPRGLLPATPPFWKSPQPPQEEEEEDEGWTPIAPPAFSRDPAPWGPPQSRDTRGPPHAPRRPKIRGAETPWDPLDPPGCPWNTPRPPWDPPDPPRTPPRLLWDLPGPARAPPTPPRPSRTPQIWNPDPLRALWDPSGPPWDPRPRSPEAPRAAPHRPGPPRTPQLWNQEPPRALPDPPRPVWDPADAPRAMWDSPDPPRSPRTPQLWGAGPPWDLPGPSRPPRDPPRPWSSEPPGAPRSTEPSRCCCRRLCRDTARRDPLYRDPLCRRAAHRDSTHRAPLCRDMARPAAPRRCQQPPRCRRPHWGGVGTCPCGGLCWGGPAR